jgi:hypothetical protein
MSQLTITITLPEHVTATVTETPRRSGQKTIPSAPMKVMPKLIDREPIAPFSLINKMIADLPKLTTSEMYELIHAIDETHRIKDLTYKEHVAAARSLYDEFQKTKKSQSAAAAIEPAGHCDCDVKKALLTATQPAGMDSYLFRKTMAFRDVTKSVTGNEKLATCSMFSSYEKWCEDALTEKEKAHLNRYQRMTRFVNEMMAPIVSALADNRREELVNVKCPSWVLDELAQAIPSNRPPKMVESPCDPFKEKLIQSLKQKKPINIDATLYQRLNDFMKCFLNVKVPASVEHVVDLFQRYEAWVGKLSEQEARHLNRYQRMTRFLNEQ